MSAELIYKTTSPAAIAWWEHLQAESARVHALRVPYIKRMTEQFGPTPATPGNPKSGINRDMIVAGPQVIGFDCGVGERPPAGSGWRLDSKTGYWKPALNTTMGKTVRAELDELVGYDIRANMHEIGIPSMALAGLHFYQPGLQFDKDTGTLYQLWGSGRCAEDCADTQAAVPDVVWSEVKRSEWYAREEAKSAAA